MLFISCKFRRAKQRLPSVAEWHHPSADRVYSSILNHCPDPRNSSLGPGTNMPDRTLGRDAEPGYTNLV
jgi:hypothetical protein